MDVQVSERLVAVLMSNAGIYARRTGCPRKRVNYTNVRRFKPADVSGVSCLAHSSPEHREGLRVGREAVAVSVEPGSSNRVAVECPDELLGKRRGDRVG